MVSRSDTPRPSPNSRMLRGSSAGRPSSVSGTPTSPADTTSLARAARPWATCIANIVAPICLAMPMIGPSIEAISGGSPAGSSGTSPSAPGRSPAIDPWTRSAMGSMIVCQAGRVVTSHSLRDQAAGRAPVAGKVVAASSHNSARSTAVSVAERSPSVTEGSPSATICLRALSLARSQLTARPSSAPGCWR